jgi:hypothetical protein
LGKVGASLREIGLLERDQNEEITLKNLIGDSKPQLSKIHAAGAFLGHTTYIAIGGFNLAQLGSSTLRPVGSLFDGFDTIVETSFILITSGNMYRVP